MGTFRGLTPVTADINLNTHKLTNVVDPTAAQDGATKNYVDTHTGTAALSGLTAATGTNTINNGTNTQTWQWNSLAANNGLVFSTSDTTSTGTLFSLSNATTTTGKGFSVAMTGTTGASINNSLTNASTTNNATGESISMTGTSGNTIGLSINNSSGNSPLGATIAIGAASNTGTNLSITNGSQSGATGINISMSGTPGASIGINSTVAANSATAHAGQFALTAGGLGGQSSVVASTHNGIGGYAYEANVTSSREAIRVTNTANPTNGNQAGIAFALNGDAGGGLRNVASVNAEITDVTNASSDGALVFKTQLNSAAPAERFRIANTGAMTATNATVADTGLSITMSATSGAGSALTLSNASATSTATVGNFSLTDTAAAGNVVILNHAGSGAANALLINKTSTSDAGAGIDIESASTGGAFGINVQMNGTTGNQRAYNASSPSNGAPTLYLGSLTGATNTGTALSLSQASTSAGKTVNLTATGTTGNQITLDSTNSSSGASAFAGRFTMSSATGAGSAISVSHSGNNASANGILLNMAAAATGNGLRIQHQGIAGTGKYPLDVLGTTATTASLDAARLFNNAGGAGAATTKVNLLFTLNRTSGATEDIARVGSEITDAGTNFKGDLYFQTATNGTATLTEKMRIKNDGSVVFPFTNTAAGTTGAQTINKISGTVNFAATASSLVLTNSLITANSIVFAIARTNDATAQVKNVVPAAGSATINLTAAATAETSVGFWVINQ